MREVDLSKKLSTCPCCKQKVVLEDCTNQELGWDGFRIICRPCRLQMFSEPITRVKVDYETHEMHTVQATDTIEDIVQRLVDRWNHRRRYDDEARA